ncbi:MAG TPA: aminopeptidase P N-terminal domain-containing protein [Candidatus Acidoferrales bacterium]|nr:aminopeptidase P N-terminal domain-containing protein [Candidatus Acidoferrales bacterium]
MSFSPEVLARRRRALMDRLGPAAAAIFPAAPISVRSNDVEFRYRQDNDFLYLTGFDEPEAVCLLLPGHAKEELVLFVRPRDPQRETWTGRRAGVEGAIASFGAQMAYPIDKLDEKVSEYVGERDQLYYTFGRDTQFNQRVVGWMRQWQQLRPRSGHGPMAVLDPSEIVHEMRLIKTDEELAYMRQAITIAAEGHRAALEAARDGVHEYEIEALLDYTFRKRGGSGPAYPSIVAAGANATILHYTTNDQPLRSGDLLLIDAGAEYQGYCADVTRTFPVAGGFSPAQRAIYDVVLQAQQAAIDVIRPGARIDAPHARAVEVLVDGLLELRLLRGERQEIISKELYRPFYMHRTSHWLGMDVHDVGKYKLEGTPRILEPGMVLTVEPGIYIAADRTDVDPRYLGIGVRIEDDVLVTATGHEVLSAAAPKQPHEIEAARSRAQ